MFYIKLEKDMKLVITSLEPIYRGDNLNQKIVYLIPKTLKKIAMETAYVYLNFVRADGFADVVTLMREEEEYNEDYFQYKLPVTCRLSTFAGEICTWMQIYTGSVRNPTVAKSGECILRVENSKSMDCYLEDRHLTALYQLHKQLDMQMEEVNQELSGKADGLVYLDEEDALQLTSKGELIGESLPVNEVVEDVMTELDIYDVINFGEEDEVLEEDDSVIEFEGVESQMEGNAQQAEDVIEFVDPDPPLEEEAQAITLEEDGIIEF